LKRAQHILVHCLAKLSKTICCSHSLESEDLIISSNWLFWNRSKIKFHVLESFMNKIKKRITWSK